MGILVLELLVGIIIVGGYGFVGWLLGLCC